MKNDSPDDPDVLVRLPELLQLLRTSRTDAYDRLNRNSPRFDKDFPRPIRYAGSRNVYWLKSELLAWRDAQIRRSRTV